MKTRKLKRDEKDVEIREKKCRNGPSYTCKRFIMSTAAAAGPAADVDAYTFRLLSVSARNDIVYF